MCTLKPLASLWILKHTTVAVPRMILITVFWCCALFGADDPTGSAAPDRAADVPDTPSDTRAAQIEKARAAKTAELAPDKPSRAERIVARLSNGIFTNIAGVPGLDVKLGGMLTGSGFAAGPQYQRVLMDDHLLATVSGEVSTRKWEIATFSLLYGRLPGDRFFATIDGAYRNFSGVNYYGPGPDSLKTGRTDYRLEDETLDGVVGVRITRPFQLSFQSGLIDVDTGSGADDRFASTTTVYSPALAPGIGQRPWYVRFGPLVSFNYLDNPNLPRSGGYYRANYFYYDDERYSAFTFRRFTGEAQQYVPLFNKTHVLAFRFRTELSHANQGDVVPFYLQPVLGGDDLRGFRPFRFYGNDMEVANAEYRWTVFSGLDLAGFYDTGKVFQTSSDFGVRRLEKSAGFGVRFLTPNGVAMRVDTGFSREGFQILVKFNPVWSETDNKVRGW